MGDAHEVQDTGAKNEALRALVVRAATDESALDELIRVLRPYVGRLCRKYARSQADADDLEQEVWLAFVKNVGRIERPEALHGWLKQVALRAAIANTRKASREVPTASVMLNDPRRQPEDGTPDVAMRAEARRLVRTALARLPMNDQVFLALLSAEDRPDYARIGSTLGRPIGSIGPTRQRTLARLRRDRAMASLAD